MARRVKHEPMQRPKGRPHPSGRRIDAVPSTTLPIERTAPRGEPIEPLTPGLRREAQTYAIGFTAQIGGIDDDE